MSGQKTPPGWYPFDDDTQAYWDGTEWTEHRAPAKKEPASQTRIWLACVAVFVGLAGLWISGTFDEFLAQFGLNYGDCAENLITGNTLCGDELEAFCDTRFGSGSDAC